MVDFRGIESWFRFATRPVRARVSGRAPESTGFRDQSRPYCCSWRNLSMRVWRSRGRRGRRPLDGESGSLRSRSSPASPSVLMTRPAWDDRMRSGSGAPGYPRLVNRRQPSLAVGVTLVVALIVACAPSALGPGQSPPPDLSIASGLAPETFASIGPDRSFGTAPTPGLAAKTGPGAKATPSAQPGRAATPTPTRAASGAPTPRPTAEPTPRRHPAPSPSRRSVIARSSRPPTPGTSPSMRCRWPATRPR